MKSDTHFFRLFSLIFVALGLITLSVSADAPAAPPAAPAAPSYDFGDSTSATLTTKAWGALNSKDYAGVKAYTNKCIDLYKEQAVQMQSTLKAPAPKDTASQLWALNDVGTCYFILGTALDNQGDKKGAVEAFKTLVDKFSFAQCYDPQGWYWAPADGARKRLAELQFDSAQ